MAAHASNVSDVVGTTDNTVVLVWKSMPLKRLPLTHLALGGHPMPSHGVVTPVGTHWYPFMQYIAFNKTQNKCLHTKRPRSLASTAPSAQRRLTRTHINTHSYTFTCMQAPNRACMHTWTTYIHRWQCDVVPHKCACFTNNNDALAVNTLFKK